MSKTVWDYGEEGTAYPVAPNQIWTVGKHYFYCHDWYAEGLAFDLFPPCVMAYVDPPYNKVAANGFYTKATLVSPVNSFSIFLGRLITLTRAVLGDVFIETGKASLSTLEDVLRDCRARVRAISEITYYRKNPCLVVQYGFNSDTDLHSIDLTGYDDEDTPGVAIQAASKAGDYVLDLCAGRGLTSRHAAKHGRYSVNVEMHPNRMSAALHRLSALTGEKPLCQTVA